MSSDFHGHVMSHLEPGNSATSGTVSSNDVNRANDELAEFVTDPDKFREKFGNPRPKATDPSQGQGITSTGPTDELHGYVLSRLSGY